MIDRTALLFGATGLVGGHVLDRLAHDSRWSRVVTLGRRPTASASGAHEDHVVDFDRLSEQAELFACDDLFCCLGTTIKKAGSEVAFRRVDLEIPFEAAQLAASEGASQMLIVTAWGADADSRFFYTRTKGEVERSVTSVGFRALHILQPSLLIGDRSEFRLGERIGQVVGSVAGPLLRGPLAPLRPIPAVDVARAMVEIAGDRSAGTHVYSPDDLRRRAG